MKKFIIFGLILCLASPLAGTALLYASSRQKTWITGEVITANDLNADWNSYYTAGVETTNLANLAVTNAKLATIDGAGKISGAALTSLSSIPSAAGVVPTANLGSGSASATTFLRGDQSYATPATLYSDTAFYIGNYTYDLSTATGTQAITGVGFQPRAVIFFACINGAAGGSWSADIGTGQGGVADNHVSVASTWANMASNSMIIYPVSGGYQAGEISTMGADGFTYSWTKSAAPTGTLNVQYIAFR